MDKILIEGKRREKKKSLESCLFMCVSVLCLKPTHHCILLATQIDKFFLYLFFSCFLSVTILYRIQLENFFMAEASTLSIVVSIDFYL